MPFFISAYFFMLAVLSLTEFEALLRTGIPLCAVIGDPISQSKSPLIHTSAFTEFQELHEWKYVAVRIEKSQLESFSKLLDYDNLMGVNVTIPHKIAVKNIVTNWDDEVHKSGAANTLYKSDGIWRLANTDVEGFLSPLKSSTLKNALVLGSGGAARAVAFGLSSHHSTNCTVVSRTKGAVTNEIEWPFTCSFVGYDEIFRLIRDSDIVVNTTPVGMGDLVEQSPLPTELHSTLKDKIAYDLIYNPMQTEFLRLAELSGARIVSGVDMFIGQAKASFFKWTRREFDSNRAKQILLNELSNK